MYAAATMADVLSANPVLSDDILREAVPGNIRKAEHFVTFLKKIVVYLKKVLQVCHFRCMYVCMYVCSCKKGLMCVYVCMWPR